MAFGSRLLGAAAVFLALGSTAHANTLANSNAFACGVEGSAQYTGAHTQNTSYQRASWPGTALDPDMPSMVKLRIIYEHPDRVEIDHCGGTVIDSKWVVTAAHCVAADRSWDRVEVLAGDTDLDGAGVVRRVSRDAICHSGFQYDGLKNDVALIRLEKPLPHYITPARLDHQNVSSAQTGSSALAAGWPVTGARAGDRRLNKTSLNIRDVSNPGYITAVSSMGAAEGVCRGESGGPLMAYGPLGLQLAGLLSGIQPGTQNGMGEECMLAGYEMYFTPIASYRSWIESVRAACDHGPSDCRGSGGMGMMLAQATAPSPIWHGTPSALWQGAPSYNGGAGYAYQSTTQAPSYNVAAATPPVYQGSHETATNWYETATAVAAPLAPTYVGVTPSYDVSYTDTTPAYVDTTPLYQNTGYIDTQPAYTPAPSYDVSYVSAQPYEVAYNEPVVTYATSFGATDTQPYSAPLYDTSVWVDTIDTAPIQYQPVQPTYIDTTPQHGRVTYNTSFSVAYANPLIVE